MAEYVCDRCGEVNPVGTVFCVSCHAFLAWEQLERDDRPEVEQNVETRMVPRIRVPATTSEATPAPGVPSPRRVPTDTTEGLFRITAEQREIALPATGEPAVLTLQVINTSDIVDGYLVESLSAPQWLLLEPAQLRLLPGSEDAMAVRMRVSSATLVAAQTTDVMLRIRSMSQAPAEAELPVRITVPAIEAPVQLHPEPSLLRVRDRDTGSCTVVVDNSRSNQPVQLRFSGSDPELAVRFRFEPPVLEVGPAASGSVLVSVTAARPEPGQEISRSFTVTARDGAGRAATTSATFLQAASVSAISTLRLGMEPSIVRITDAESATVQVTLDNRRGRSGVRVFLDGKDPEGAIQFTFSPPVVDLTAGQVTAVFLRLYAWRPEPGKELTRQFRVTASDGSVTIEESGSLVQASSRAAIEVLTVHLNPSVLRLSSRRRGYVRAVLDNRDGAQPLRVTMRGDDPENAARFDFAANTLDIPPGQMATTKVTITVPRVSAGQEVTRPFNIVASDGRLEAQGHGTLIQSAASRRPLARLLLTALGALAMIIGAFLPWLVADGLSGVDLDAATFAAAFGFTLDLRGAEYVISVGLAILVLAVLMIFGLASRSGRLSRLSALLGALLVVGTFVAAALNGNDIRPDRGAVLVLAGCVAGYIGGLLARR